MAYCIPYRALFSAIKEVDASSSCRLQKRTLWLEIRWGQFPHSHSRNAQKLQTGLSVGWRVGVISMRNTAQILPNRECDGVRPRFSLWFPKERPNWARQRRPAPLQQL